MEEKGGGGEGGAFECEQERGGHKKGREAHKMERSRRGSAKGVARRSTNCSSSVPEDPSPSASLLVVKDTIHLRVGQEENWHEGHCKGGRPHACACKGGGGSHRKNG